MKLLKHKISGAIFPWTKHLADNELLEEYIPPPKEPDIKDMAKEVLFKRKPKTR